MVPYVFICFPRFLMYIISLVQKKGRRRGGGHSRPQHLVNKSVIREETYLKTSHIGFHFGSKKRPNFPINPRKFSTLFEPK